MGPGKYDTTYLLALLASPAPYAPVLSCLVTISVRALIQVLALYPFAFGFDSDDVEPLFMLTFMSPSPIFRHTLRLKPDLRYSKWNRCLPCARQLFRLLRAPSF